MRIVCFPHFYYLSEVSRLVEIGKALRSLGQDVQFFSHGGTYEWVARDAGFDVVPVPPTMSRERAREYMAFNRGERGNPFSDSFFTYEELKAYVAGEATRLREMRTDAVLIGWNLPSYLSVQLVDIPIIVQQPGPFTAPFFDRHMGVFVPNLVGWLHHLPLDWLVNWVMPRLSVWVQPFNQLAAQFGLPRYKSTLDLMAGDLTLVMDAPEILGISPEELEGYKPRHPGYFRRTPRYRYGGPCFAKLPGEVPETVRQHFHTSRTKLYCGMGVSGSAEVLRSLIDIVAALDLQAVVVTTTILGESERSGSERVLLLPHVPAHRVNPLADIALTHGGAGTVQTAIHAGTPLLGVPMHIEQAGNISLVQRQGAGIMLARSALGPGRLAVNLEKLVHDARYRENMLRLKQLQDPIDGAGKAAQELIRFLEGRG